MDGCFFLFLILLTACALITTIAALRFAIADLSLGYATAAPHTFVLGIHMLLVRVSMSVCVGVCVWVTGCMCARTHLVSAAIAERIVLVLVLLAVGNAIADALNRNAIAIVTREFNVFEAIAAQ